MKPLALLFCCILCLSVVSCVKWPEQVVKKREILYTNNWQQLYIAEKLDSCRKEVAILTLAIYESEGRKRSKEGVVQLEKMLMDQCARYYNVMF